MTPYYDDGTCVIYHCDWRSWIDLAKPWPGDVLLTDPPYGIAYESGAQRIEGNARGIPNDADTTERDDFLCMWHGPALVFGSPKSREPEGVKARLVWDQDGALGMGDLSLPWKPSWQLVYVLGGPWGGTRDCGSVLRCPPVQSLARLHPHQKPISLLGSLIDKCIPGVVLDPFMGSGSTLVAAKERGRCAVGFEIEERYCEIAAKRLGQEVLPLEAS